MTTRELLQELQRRRIQITVEGEKLCVHAPKGACTPDLKAYLQAHKAAVIAVLSSSQDEQPQHQETCIHCADEAAFYSDDGQPYCQDHRHHPTREQGKAVAGLVRVTHTPFFLQDLAQIGDELASMGKLIALDLETTGLNPLHDRVVSITLGSPGHVSVLDMRPYYQLPPARQQEWKQALAQLLQHPSLTWIGHHLKFDLMFLAAHFGISLSRVYDTMLVEQLLHGVGPHDAMIPVNLHSTAARCQIQVSKEQRAWFPGLHERKEWSEPFPPEQLAYMVQDVEVPCYIHQRQQHRIDQDGLATVVQLEHQALPAMASMELRGVLIDQERWRAILHRKLQRQQDLERKLAAILGAAHKKACDAYQRALQTEEQRLVQLYRSSPQQLSWERFRKNKLIEWKASHRPPVQPKASQRGGNAINLASSPQLITALNALGIPVQSTREEALELYAARHTLIADLLEWKKLQKFRSTFGENILAMIGSDGRLRGEFAQIGAVSGRIICSKPNLQQIPAREKKQDESIRQCFIAPPGSRLLKADLSNIELRILAEVSHDTTLIRLFAEGKDLHAETAKLMFHLPPETDTRTYQYKGKASAREIAKTINYGLAYGMGAQGLATRIGVTIETAKALMHTYFATYAGVAAWLRTTAQQSLKQGYAVTLAGRRRPFVLESGADQAMRGEMERAAKNHPIQGTNADIIKRALALLHERLPHTASLVLAVHDEIVLECPEHLVQEVAHILKRSMVEACTDFLKVVPIPEPDVVIDTYWKKEERGVSHPERRTTEGPPESLCTSGEY